MKWRLLSATAAFWLCLSGGLSAQVANLQIPDLSGSGNPAQTNNVDPARTNSVSAADDLAARMARQEAELQAMRAEIQRLREEPVRLPPVEATPTAMAPAQPPAAPAVAQGEYFTMDEIRGEMKKLAWKKGDFTLTPYGCLWGNSVYSTQRTTPGSYTLFVQSPSLQNEGEFIVDARNTRLGMDVGGPEIPFFDCAPTFGKVEIDFQSALTAPENKASVLLRHAYVEAKNDDFRLLIGQTWDVISPLYPTTVLYSVGWDAGDIGYRRAQVRGERFLAFSDTSLLTAQLSINQQIFEDSTTDVRGEPSNWPVCEGRVAWTIGERGKDCKPIVVGVSGHIGNEEFDSAIFGQNNERRTWSGNIDIRIPIGDRFGIQGECFTGENLGAFLGGIGQGIDPLTGDTIRSSGGWVELWYYWTPRFHSHVGYSIDDPNDNDLVLATEKKYNQFYFGNICFDLTKQCMMGLEVSSWKTMYVGLDTGNSVRSEFVLKYWF